MKSFCSCALVLTLLAVEDCHAAPVLMISVDGLKPEYVFEADAHDLKIPYLRGVLAEGAYARAVVGVWPTITYPSHTTLVTGVAPAVHGIHSNLEFDPYQRFKESWYWYARQIRVPTLWQAAHAKGIVTASIGWPVTVGANGIDYLIPEYWRGDGADRAPQSIRPRVDCGTIAAGRGDGPTCSNQPGPYLQGNDTSSQGDEIKTVYALDVLRRRKPGFMTLHLSSLDDAQHGHGVFSMQANAVLEAIDGMLDRLAQAARANDPAAVVAIVSDHGFAAVTHEINLYVPFLNAGLIEATQEPGKPAMTIRSWRAEPWFAGGMAAIMLQDPNDSATEKTVAALLRALAADAGSGIATVEDKQQLSRHGGFPEAAFLVTFKPGFYAGLSMTGPLITDIKGAHGGHGFSPDSADMRAAFFISGTGIAHHRDLGVVDMRQVAPTIARLLTVELPSAHSPALRLGE